MGMLNIRPVCVNIFRIFLFSSRTLVRIRVGWTHRFMGSGRTMSLILFVMRKFSPLLLLHHITKRWHVR